MLKYIPDQQFKGQLRELVAILRDWQDKGKTNHLLINHVTDYPKSHLLRYYSLYSHEYKRRYRKEIGIRITRQFIDFCFDENYKYTEVPFPEWHNKTYIRIAMANLLEKHLAAGRSKITDDEWKCLCEGYKAITGEKYVL